MESESLDAQAADFGRKSERFRNIRHCLMECRIQANNLPGLGQRALGRVQNRERCRQMERSKRNSRVQLSATCGVNG